MPLHKVGAAHECTVLRCAAVVVPQIEVGEVDRVREWRSGKRAILAQVIHDRLGGKDLRVGALDNLFALAVDAVDQRLRVALRADLLHVDLRLQVVRSMSRDRVGKIPAEPVRRIVRDLQAVDAAHVARRAGGHEHVARCKRARIGVELQQISLRREHDPVLRLVVDLDLRVIGAHVALAACAWQARELNGTRVPGVALRTRPNRSVVVGLADGVALLATGRGCRMPFRKHQRIRRTLRAARLELLAEGDLLRT